MRENNWVYNLFHSIKYSKWKKTQLHVFKDIQFKDKYIDISKTKRTAILCKRL